MDKENRVVVTVPTYNEKENIQDLIQCIFAYVPEAHVLVIDDDSGLRRTASLILEDEGYSVVTAADGKDGLEKAQKESPDLILSDVQIGGYSMI